MYVSRFGLLSFQHEAVCLDVNSLTLGNLLELVHADFINSLIITLIRGVCEIFHVDTVHFESFIFIR